jgi:hypothetical protein
MPKTISRADALLDTFRDLTEARAVLVAVREKLTASPSVRFSAAARAVDEAQSILMVAGAHVRAAALRA